MGDVWLASLENNNELTRPGTWLIDMVLCDLKIFFGKRWTLKKNHYQE